MQSVTVNVGDLLEVVKQNRGNHRGLFEKAQEVYRKEVIKELDRMIDEAKARRRIGRFISLPEPEDHTSDYDRIIRMLEMTVDGVIELTQQEFAWYVMDQWGWTQSFTTSTLSYLSKEK